MSTSPSMPPPKITVVRDAAQLAERAADWFTEMARAAVAATGRFTVALAGGSTPEGLYRELARRSDAGDSAANDNIPWPQIHVFFGDERFVPRDHPESNYRMARETLLDHVPVPASQVFPMPTEQVTPPSAAAAYQRTLHQEFAGSSLSTNGFPALDLILLGMGPDGHTASLFPGTDVVHEQQLWVASPWVKKFNTFRITLTPPVLCAAKNVLFLISGKNKADVLHAVLNGPHQPDLYPCQIVRPTAGYLHWLVDEAAAAKLSK